MIIVTGGAGFIGSAIIWRLNMRGVDDILVVDTAVSAGERRNLDALRYTDYIQHEDFLGRFLEGEFDATTDAVVHMGACSDTTETDVAYLERNNFDYSVKLAEHASARGMRFVYASSAATYGDGKNGYSDDESLLSELLPLNPYAESKHRFDMWVQEEGLLETIVGLKYFNVFGPNEYHKGEMRSVVAKALGQVRAEGIIRLFKSYREEYADGEPMRDFIYVKDAVEMTLFFLDNLKVGGIFNIGSGEAQTWNTLARAVFAALDLKPRIEYVDMPDSLRGRYQYHTEAEIAKLREAGCSVPVTPLVEAVRDYVQGYLVGGHYLGGEGGAD